MRQYFDRLRIRRQLRDFGTLDAAAREGDRVQVTGIVEATGDLLLAPISDLGCVAFAARARGYTTRGGRRITTLWRETVQLARFALVLEDRTRVLVDGDHAELGVTGASRVARQPHRESSFLAEHGIHLGGARFDERVIEVGRRVTVGGTLVLVPAASSTSERGFRDTPMQWQLAGSREHPLVIVTT